ncbi:unnamed protein product [Caenorhabditis sp. 36 PRJEB53466]|nr:unnamed protein product [Caenorhabditis sp. 36 PRJEB53466]
MSAPSLSEMTEKTGLMDDFAAILMEKMVPALQAMSKKKEEEKAPTLSQKGLQMQAELNAKVIKLISEGLEGGDMTEAGKEVLNLMSERNKELVLLDKDPDTLRTWEKIKAVKELTGAAPGAMDTAMLAWGHLFKSDKPANRKPPPRLKIPKMNLYMGENYFSRTEAFQLFWLGLLAS